VNQYLEQIKNFYGQLDASRRKNLWTGVAAAVVLIVGVGAWSRHTPYTTLFSARSAEQVLNAAATLETEGIPYRMGSDGSLSVPSQMVGSAWGAAAAAEVYENAEDPLPLGLSPMEIDHTFLSRRQMALQKMIGDIDGVSSARVSVVEGTDGRRLLGGREATASVFVQMSPTKELSSLMVQGITNMVANSVAGLTAKNVSVTDHRGKLWAEGRDVDGGALTPSNLFEYQSQLEARLRDKIIDALRPVLGSADRFSVAASVAIDRTSSETTSNTFDVDSQAVIAQELSEQSTENSSAGEGGVPGVDANLPEEPAEAAAGQNNRSDQTREKQSFGYPTVKTVMSKPSGGVISQSVSVTVDQAVLDALPIVASPAAEGLAEEAAEAAIADADMTSQQLTERVQSIVEGSVGMDASRGDKVTVTVMRFASGPAFVGGELMEASVFATAEPWLPYAVMMLALGVVYLIISPLTKSILEEQRARHAEAVAVEKEEEEDAEEEEDLTTKLRQMVEDYQVVDAGELNNLVARQAEASAQVIRLWAKQG